MIRQKAGPNDKRVIKRRAFLRATANLSALAATLSTSLGVNISQAVAGGKTLLKLDERRQIKLVFFRRPGGGDRTALREYALMVEEGRVLLVNPDGKRDLAKDGQYLLEDGRLVTVSNARITEVRAAKGEPTKD